LNARFGFFNLSVWVLTVAIGLALTTVHTLASSPSPSPAASPPLSSSFGYQLDTPIMDRSQLRVESAGDVGLAPGRH
jgi:hypothetical protein